MSVMLLFADRIMPKEKPSDVIKREVVIKPSNEYTFKDNEPKGIKKMKLLKRRVSVRNRLEVSRNRIEVWTRGLD